MSPKLLYSGPDNQENDPRLPPDWAVGTTMYEHLKAMTWCLAELRWQYDHHVHGNGHGGYGYNTSWGPTLPHWL